MTQPFHSWMDCYPREKNAYKLGKNDIFVSSLNNHNRILAACVWCASGAGHSLSKPGIWLDTATLISCSPSVSPPCLLFITATSEKPASQSDAIKKHGGKSHDETANYPGPVSSLHGVQQMLRVLLNTELPTEPCEFPEGLQTPWRSRSGLCSCSPAPQLWNYKNLVSSLAWAGRLPSAHVSPPCCFLCLECSSFHRFCQGRCLLSLQVSVQISLNNPKTPWATY